MQVGRGRRLTGRCRLLLPPQPLHSHQRHGFTSLIPPPHAHSFHYTTLRPPSPPHPHPSRLCVHLPGLGWRRRRRLGRLGPSSTPSPSQPLLIVACYCDMREYSICVRLMQMQPLASWSRGGNYAPILLYSTVAPRAGGAGCKPCGRFGGLGRGETMGGMGAWEWIGIGGRMYTAHCTALQYNNTIHPPILDHLLVHVHVPAAPTAEKKQATGPAKKRTPRQICVSTT